MRSTGKELVTENTYLDGNLHHSTEVKRNVYRKADGSEWILSAKRYFPVVRNAGKATVRFDVRTVQPIDMSAILKQGNVQITPVNFK